MNVIRKISLVMNANELKSAVQYWIRQTDADIANHLAKNRCNFVINNEGEDGFTITIDIAGEFIDSAQEE
tara:strand:- start:293 stop:502 length:210 start_codon:yes stop_codon:yes gene_type:complete